ncbi:MAG: zinc-ribbon domain-containing protein [Tannerella sp.]|jgi:predicted Zn finger-like uncharacterized protein|nr:zinc-ribbon domain-containing protein [Tannerella sp.]
MIIKCPKCGVGIRIDESQHAPGNLLRVTCPKCREVLSVGIPGLASAASPTPASELASSPPWGRPKMVDFSQKPIVGATQKTCLTRKK